MNRRRILDVLKEQGALTQVEIAAVTGLSPATVSNLVRELDTAGAVDLAPSVRNGRRATQVSLAAASGLLGAIVFGDRDIRVAIGRGDDDILAMRRMPLAASYVVDEQLVRATRLLSEVVEDAGHSVPELRAMCVGIPAPIDVASQQVGDDGILPAWAGVPIVEVLQEALNTSVVLDNTANLGALAEARVGYLRGIEQGVYLRASHGVGAGLIINGSLYRGAGGAAGEIGHLTVDENGAVCRCGNRGCLDTVVGSEAMLRVLRPTHGETITLRDAIQRALAGDAGCARVLGDAGRHLGIAAANLVNVLNPQVIVVGGELARVGELVLGPMRAAMERRAIRSAVRSVEVWSTALSPNDSDVVGALAAADEVRGSADLAALVMA